MRQHLKQSFTMATDLTIARAYFPEYLIPKDEKYAQILTIWKSMERFRDVVNQSPGKSLIIPIQVPADEWEFTNSISSEEFPAAEGLLIAGTVSNWILPFKAQSADFTREVISVFLLFSKSDIKEYSKELELHSAQYVLSSLHWGVDGEQANPNVTFLGMPDAEEDKEDLRSESSHSESGVLAGDAEEYAQEDARIADIEGLSTPDLEVFSCNFKEITALVSSTAIRLNSKILSVGFHLFPWIRAWMRKKFLVAKYSDAAKVYTTLKSPENVAKSRLATEDYIAATALCMLGMAYNNDKTRVNQILSRVKALLATITWTTITDSKIASWMGDITWDTKDVSREVVEMLGRILAVDESLKYNRCLEKDQLISAATAGALTPHPILFTALYEQMRMVYEDFHSVSLRFGLSVLELVRKSYLQMGGAFAKEIKTASKLKSRVTSQPFISLAAGQPEELQTKNHPRLIYGGLLYNIRCLEGTPAAKQFEDYAITKICESIPSMTDRTLVKDAIAALPSATATAVASFVRGLGIREANAQIDHRSADFKEEVYKILAEDLKPCEWVVQETAAKSTASMQKFYREAATLMKTRVEDLYKEDIDRASRELNAEKKIKMYDRAQTWKTKFYEVMGKTEQLDKLLTGATGEFERAARKEIVTRLSGLFEKITKGPSDSDAMDFSEFDEVMDF